MTDLAGFARRIRQIGKQVEKGANTTIIKAAIAADQALVLATPVDTGRARANWQVSIGTPIRAVLLEEDQAGQATIDRNNSRIKGRRLGQKLFISNNVSYINELNDGTSSQAPKMFIQIAVQAAIRTIRGIKVIT